MWPVELWSFPGIPGGPEFGRVVVCLGLRGGREGIPPRWAHQRPLTVTTQTRPRGASPAICVPPTNLHHVLPDLHSVLCKIRL